MQVSGILKFRSDFQKKTENFGYKEIWVETIEQYPQTVVIHLANDRSDLADPYQIGQEIKVSLNLKGKPYQDKNTGQWKCFTSIHGWKVEAVVKNQPEAPSYSQPQQGYTQPGQQFQGQYHNNSNQQNQQPNYANTPQQGYTQPVNNNPTYGGVQNYGQQPQQAFPGQQNQSNQEDSDGLPF